jgi:hypothetical protein
MAQDPRELDSTSIERVSDLIYSVNNLCIIFNVVRDCAPNSLRLLPTIVEEIYIKANTLIELCIVKEEDD